MPFSGLGIYTVPAGTTAIPTTIISDTAYNNFLADLQTALSTVMLQNGVGIMTGNLNMGGFKAVNLAPGTTGTDGIRYDQVFPYLQTKWISNFEQFIDADNAMTASWGLLTSNIVSMGLGTGILSITRFGEMGAAINGPYFIRATDGSWKLINSATLVCPGGVDFVATANAFIMLIPFSTTNGTVADAYRVVASA